VVPLVAAASVNSAEPGLWLEHCHTNSLINHPQSLTIHTLTELF